MTHSKLATLALPLSLALIAGPASAQIKGPSSSETPYLVPVAGDAEFTSILTVGDAVKRKHKGNETYRLVGLPDGMGTYENEDGTLTLLVNHEIGTTSGIARSHGAKGAFVSAWQIRKSDLKVLNGDDLINMVMTWDASASAWVQHPSNAFGRFCSADHPGITAFFNSKSGLGFPEGRIYLNGEENGPGGRVFAHIIQGRQHGWSYELPSLGRASWENYLASPYEQDKTVALGTDDTNLGKVYLYVGMKRSNGNPVELAGLHGGSLHAVAIAGASVELRTLPPASGTRFSLVSPDAAAGTRFLRPEDGAWDTQDPNRFYFVTTDRYDQVKDNVGSQIGRTRLWRLNFDSIENPEAGGTVDMLLDGTEAGQMYDNLAMDGAGKVYLQEDPGGVAHNAKIWKYDPDTRGLSLLAKHDPFRFGDIGMPAAPGFNNDEESSGIIEATGFFAGVPGYDTGAFRYFFLNVQAHISVPDPELVQKGQILLMRTAR